MVKPLLAIGLGSLLFIAVGCGDARCDPNPVGEPWKQYESLLPDKAVVCGPNRKSAKKASDVVDNYPPTQVFVFYEEKEASSALLATTEKFEKAGWRVVVAKSIGEGESALYRATATKDGTSIEIQVNRNDWGTQGSFMLEQAKPTK